MPAAPATMVVGWVTSPSMMPTTVPARRASATHTENVAVAVGPLPLRVPSMARNGPPVRGSLVTTCAHQDVVADGEVGAVGEVQHTAVGAGDAVPRPLAAPRSVMFTRSPSTKRGKAVSTGAPADVD